MRPEVILAWIAAAAASCAWLRARRTLAAARAELAHSEVALHTDELTGLHNRRALHRDITARRADGRPWSLLLLDLDHFKTVNDRHGHAAGDRLLIHLAGQLADGSVEHAGTYRLHGDEFAILMPVAAEAALPVAGRLVDTLATPIQLAPGLWCAVSASAGLADGWPDATTGDVLHRADIALYQAKQTRGTVRLYTHHRTQPSGEPGPPPPLARRTDRSSDLTATLQRLSQQRALWPYPSGIHAHTGGRHV